MKCRRRGWCCCWFGLLLAFTLKEDKFDVKFPLIKRAPVTSDHEYYNQVELKYNETLLLDVNNELAVNTVVFLEFASKSK